MKTLAVIMILLSLSAGIIFPFIGQEDKAAVAWVIAAYWRVHLLHLYLEEKFDSVLKIDNKGKK